MSRKRDKFKRFLRLGGDESTLAVAPTPNAATLQPYAATIVTNATAQALGTGSAPQTPPVIVQDDPKMTTKAVEWWKEHRQRLMGALELVLTIAEKAIVVVPPAQAAVGAAGAGLKVLRLMDENNTTIEEIVNHVDEIIQDLVRFTLPSPVALPASISPDAVVRINKFNERLSKIKTSAAGHSVTSGSFFQRLLNAERISEELNDAWKDVSFAYDELITTTVLGTEAKVVGVHARVEEVHERVEDVQDSVIGVQDSVIGVQDSVIGVRGLVANVQMGQTTQKEEALLDRLHPVKSAFHDAHGAAPACLEGTRTQLLDEISVWMADPSAKLVYWLTGVAGTGKTTIAQSVAYMAEARGCLAGTFFFSRTMGSAERRQSVAVIRTVAYQLAYRHQALRDCICGAVSSDRDIYERQVARQAQTLLTNALQGIREGLPLSLVVVLDALDECDKENGREGGDLIPVLLRSLDKLPFSIKIFVTSRPEPSIKNMFSRADIHGSTVGLALHRDIEQSIVREDIGRYLRHEFDQLAHQRSVPRPFPSDADFQTLIDRAGHLFIYVRTIVMYVSSEVEDPIDQLADVLRADRAPKQFSDLDALYTQILIKASDVVGRDAAAQRQLRDVLASLALVKENLAVAALAVLAGVEERQCKMILRCLSSVLLYEHTSLEPVRLIHPSFPDFLTHEDRCTDARYFVSSAEYHSLLALRCLQIMNLDLRRDICDIRNPFMFNFDVHDLDQRLDRNASMQLRYACKYWHVHVQLAGCLDANLITVLNMFCTKHLLHWLELLSLIDEIPLALRDLPPLRSYLESCNEMRQGRIRTLLTDVERLLLAYKMPIIVGALHVYWSALVTMPFCLLWEETAPHDGHGIPMLVTKRALGWGVREPVLEADYNIDCLAYSPNGKLIALVFLSGGLQVWDVATGMKLCGISVPGINSGHFYTSVGFSPNSQWIVSGGTDWTARLWDVVTGSQHQVMRGHTSSVSCVAFSPDGVIIASGSHDHTLRTWDASTGAPRLVITSHTIGVESLAFAPNGQTIVSASADGTLRVWDVLTGTDLYIIKHDTDKFRCVAFSPDGAIIASSGPGVDIQLRSAANGTRQHVLQGHIDGVRSFAFSPDSRSIVSCDGSGLARIWDVTTGIEKHNLQVGVQEYVAAVTYSPDGKSIAMGFWTGSIRILDANTSVAAHPILEGHQAQIKSVTFSPDGLLIASSSDDSTLRIWDAITGIKRHVMEVGNAVRSIAFSPNNRTIACGQRNGTVQLWDVASGLKQSSMMGHHASVVVSVAFSSDGKSVVSYSAADGIARVWDAATGAEQHILTYPVARSGIDSTIRPVAFSANGKAIIIRKNHSSRVVEGFWDLTTTQLEYTELTSPHERTPALDDFYTSEQHYFEGSDSTWIGYCAGQKLMACVWLPPERRGTFAYSGTKMCTGGRDGTITILDFSHVGLPQQVV